MSINHFLDIALLNYQMHLNGFPLCAWAVMHCNQSFHRAVLGAWSFACMFLRESRPTFMKRLSDQLLRTIWCGHFFNDPDEIPANFQRSENRKYFAAVRGLERWFEEGWVTNTLSAVSQGVRLSIGATQQAVSHGGLHGTYRDDRADFNDSRAGSHYGSDQNGDHPVSSQDHTPRTHSSSSNCSQDLTPRSPAELTVEDREKNLQRAEINLSKAGAKVAKARDDLRKSTVKKPPKMVEDYAARHGMEPLGVDADGFDIVMKVLLESTDTDCVPLECLADHAELVNAIVSWVPVDYFFRASVSGRQIGQSPMHVMCNGVKPELRRAKTIKIVLDRLSVASQRDGIDYLKTALEARDPNNRLPVIIAASTGFIDGVDLLADYGAELDVEYWNGKETKHLYQVAYKANKWWAKRELYDMLKQRGIPADRFKAADRSKPDASSSTRIAAGRRICVAVE